MSYFPTNPKTVSAEIIAPRKVESRRTSAPVELLYTLHASGPV